MSNKTTNIIAIVLLALMAATAVLSMKNDSVTMDEVAHLPAGYSYVTQKDMRLNPEHPPLIKDFAGIPLLFIKNITFPYQIKSWQEDVNGQWDFGYNFLFQNNNPVDKMIFWARVPMILILLLLGFYLFRWTRELLGNKAALLALFLFCFSPTFLAHGRLVTTDVGAATGAFISLYYFVKALKNPSAKNIILSGIALAIAQLFKFSLFMLFPIFVLIGIVAWLVKTQKFFPVLKVVLLTFIITAILIWPVYLFHTINYPTARQINDINHNLQTYPIKPLVKLTTWMANQPILKPYAQYTLGVLMVTQRATGGHTTYFLGETSNKGWKTYFPIVYIIKEPLTLHILTIIALLYLAWLIQKPFWFKPFSRTKKWLQNHFPEFAMLAFIALYWASSLTSSLNIGVRHLLPTFPFIYLLVSGVIVKWMKPPRLKLKYGLLILLILWQIFSVVKIYPHFLAYFNEIAGGPDNGYIYTVDSNLDWGQDLKRLNQWVNERGIDKIYVDYFGGSDPKYYLGDKYREWHGDYNSGDFPKNNYFAISATYLQKGRGEPGPGVDPSGFGFYRWLDQYQLVDKIGYSIFVYYID